MDTVALIQRLGWDWRDDGMGLGLGPGVLVNVRIKGQKKPVRAFVPLAHVWLAFDRELGNVGCVGCVGSAWVGEPFCAVGLFGFIKKAVSSVTKQVAKVIPKAIKKAAATVVNTAKSAASAVAKVPVLGSLVKAQAALALLPAAAAAQLVQGKRIDAIAVNQFKTALGSAKTLAPYVQTVVSFVPGIGQGISAGIGGGLALASGQSITDAMIAAAKSAVPGGPIAQAAFSVATDAIQGKPLNQSLLNALPISQQAKTALLSGIDAAKRLASGQNVSQTVIDAAMKNVPAQYQKAIQIGVALGHAKNLQQAAGAAAQGATQIAGLANGTPAQRALAQSTLARVVQQAQQGHQQANNIVKAVQMLRPPALSVPRLNPPRLFA
jgi:hypothetical protein